MKKKKIIILSLTLSLLFLMAAGAFWKREGIKARLGAWRASSLIEEAKELGIEGRWDEAFDSSLAAWQLDSGSVEVLRKLHQSALRSGNPRSLGIARVLFSHPQATTEERIGAIRLFFGLGDHVSVASMFAALTEEERQSVEALELGAEFLLARNNVLAAFEVLNTLKAKRFEPRDAYLTASGLARLSSENDEARKEAQRIIDELLGLKSDPELAFSAFLLLDRIPEESWELDRFSDVESRLESISSSNPAPLPVHLLIARLKLAEFPERREQILTSMVETHFSGAPEAVSNWLIRLGETEFVRRRVSQQQAEIDPVAFGILIKCCFKEGEWEEATRLLSKAPAQVEPSTLFALKAVAATGNGDSANARNWWERALRQADLSSGRETYLRLAKIAASAGEEEIRNQAVTAALKQPSLIPIPASDVSFVFSHLVESGSGDDLLTISLNMLEREPDNPQLVNNVAWLFLMNGRSATGMIDQLEEFCAEYQKMPGLHTTLSLAHYHEGNVERAKAVLNALLPGMSHEALQGLGETDKAVIRLILGEAAQSTSLAGSLSELKFDEMMELERDYFQQAFNQRSSSNSE